MKRNRQLSLGIIEQYDADAKRRNQDAILRAHKEQYPMTEEEKSWLPKGVRLARFVHDSECEKCNLGCTDHTEGWKWGQPVCIKDVRKWEKKLGRPLVSSFQLEGR